ncbi:LacI family DNA-binding transcriptional regulator [Parapedobacter lycopersici]|uniref:LacI family DNA-binding transcriptional regulator n=1 Tax=Parapedobacter lycopersici TaxID=1864939 RepID=UPI00214D6B9B|nr:substrate-binding domain-containing protein [Parapedobacter lycopersici]
MEKRNHSTPLGIKEIAKRANVSIGTVDRVIHNRPGVSKKTKEKINAIINELGYQPNLIARRLASKKLIRIATLTPRVPGETVYWEVLLNGIIQAESEIESYGVRVDKYFFDQNDKGSFDRQAELLLQTDVDGVMLTPIFIEESTRFANACKARNIPYVFINSDLPQVESLSYIGPNLFDSGYLVAHLIRYLSHGENKVLVANISKELESHHYTLRKEEGFRAYFSDNPSPIAIVKVDIRQTDYESVEQNIAQLLDEHQDIRIIFATNSRVSTVARYLEKSGKRGLLLIGYDFLPENIEYLKKGTIDFLIGQKPHEQAYRGVMALYQHLAFATEVDKVNFMPIDIITRENYAFYRN